MSQLLKISITTLIAAATLSSFGCKAKQEAAPTKTAVAIPANGSATSPVGTVVAANAAGVTVEEWEDCDAAGEAHKVWVAERIATDAGKTLAGLQGTAIQKLCIEGKWTKGTVACFYSATDSAATDKCAEKLSAAQKTSVSDLFTEILNAGKAAAVGSGSAGKTM